MRGTPAYHRRRLETKSQGALALVGLTDKVRWRPSQWGINGQSGANNGHTGNRVEWKSARRIIRLSSRVPVSNGLDAP